MVKDLIPGGKADNVPRHLFDKKQRAAGRKTEMEHTNNPAIAEELSTDHFVETDKDPSPRYDSDYYDNNKGLPDMERRLEGEDEDGVILGINSNNDVVILIKTPSGRYDIHKFDDDDRSLDKPVKVSDYNRDTGHVQEHYRGKRMN